MTVGILSNDSFGRFTFPIIEALERRLADEGIAVFMCDAADDPVRERRHLDQLLGKRVDGLIFTARRSDNARQRSACPDLAVDLCLRAGPGPEALGCCPTTEAGRVWRSSIWPGSAAGASPV